MYKFSNERLLQQLFFPFQRNECRFKGDNTDFIAIFSIVHISNFAYMENHKHCSFSTFPKKNPPDSSRQRRGKERKNGRPKFFSRLHVSVSTRWPESAKMASNISTCFVLCTVSNRKQENTLESHLISLTTPEICVQSPE